MAVQVGLQRAVPVGPAPQRPLGVAVRRRCSWSQLAALTLATSSLSSGSELRLALSISSAALAGSAATPSETAVACSNDSAPAKAAAATSGWSASRRPVSRARLAAAGLIPAWSASCSDAERYPSCCQLLPSAARAAARALIDAGRRLDLRAQPDHLARLRRGQRPRRRTGRHRQRSIVEAREALGTWRVVQLVEGVARPAPRRRSRPTHSSSNVVRRYPTSATTQHESGNFSPHRG